MNLLLDTHIALWAITADKKLSDKARKLIKDPGNTIWVSAASVWEIAIKHGLGKGGMPVSSSEAIAYFSESGYKFLPIDENHAAAVETLPAHHADPFDRLLVAQAQIEPMHLLTRDPLVLLYGGNVLAV